MRLIATLACRINSSRLYGKPLQRLKDHTVLDYMVNALNDHPSIDGIVLAISEARGNEAFIEYAEEKKLKYVLGDDRDVLGRLIRACDAGGGDTVFRVTTESPFPWLHGIEAACESHIRNGADYTTVSNLPDGSNFEIISLEALKRSHRDGDARHRSELCTLFIYEHQDQFRMNILPAPESLSRPSYRLTIDFPEDLILCRRIVEHFGGDSKPIALEEIIPWLDANPKMRALVEDIVQVGDYVKPYFNE